MGTGVFCMVEWFFMEKKAPALPAWEHRRFQRGRVSTRQRATGIVRA
jgi:hypothetical protein